MKPLGTRILVERDEKETETSFGLILTGKEEAPLSGTVLDANKSKLCKKGDKVLFSRYMFDEYVKEKKVYALVQEEGLLAIL